jgi:hypothetical protein
MAPVAFDQIDAPDNDRPIRSAAVGRRPSARVNRGGVCADNQA